MAKDKIRKFAEFSSFDNSFDFPYHLNGKWHTEYFKNNNPIVLELGCGKGEYTVALAQEFKNKNFIGIDLRSNRIWSGAKAAKENNITNAAFMRALVEKVSELFAPNEIEEIWLTFSDPFPKDKHAKHRLSHPRFLKLYHQVLKPNGVINLKTDDDGLFNFTLETLAQLNVKPIVVEPNVYESTVVEPYVKNIKTHYEKLFAAKGRTIKYMQFTLPTLEAIEGFLANEKVKNKVSVALV
jgi:tRNA (guanine-N7-)-methyltransferase